MSLVIACDGLSSKIIAVVIDQPRFFFLSFLLIDDDSNNLEVGTLGHILVTSVVQQNKETPKG